jgi:predicted PurR-regulated permease PerM
MHTSPSEKYFLFALISIVIVITVAIFYPFLTVVILSAAFAVLLDPIYRWLKKKVTGGIEWIAAMLSVILFIILLCGPLFLIGTLVFNQTHNVYDSIVQSKGSSTFTQALDISVNKIMPKGIVFDAESKIANVVSFVSDHVAGFFTSTFKSMLMFILMIFTIFYLLKDGDNWKDGFIKLLPLSENHANEILSKLGSSINRILKGYFFIAIIQGISVGLGLYIFGVPNPAIWGVAASIASFIPTIGTSIILIPAIIFLYTVGMHMQALGLLIWSIVLVGVIDNAIAPYVISKNTEVPSIFILFSILGGVALIGPVGILIGPLSLSLLYTLVSIYRKDMR